MDVALPEYELRRRRALRLARALPLLALLMAGTAVGLNRLGAALPVALIGAALCGVIGAHGLVLLPGGRAASLAPAAPAPSGEHLTQA